MEADADFAKDEKGHCDMMMFGCTKKVKRGLALLLAAFMMLFVTDLSEVKVMADEPIKSLDVYAGDIVYGDDYYNPAGNKLEFVSFGKVGNDGSVALTFTHASDYTIVLADSVINRVESPGTGNDGDMWRSRCIVALGCAFMVVGMGVFYTNRKKKTKL